MVNQNIQEAHKKFQYKGSKMATRIQPQTFWPLWSRDVAEKMETHLTEVKHQGELKHQHSETLAHGRPLHATIY
jgi:hypothetical protein